MACAFRTWGQHKPIVSSEIKYLQGEQDGADDMAVSTELLKRHPIENVSTSFEERASLAAYTGAHPPALAGNAFKQEPIARRLVRLAPAGDRVRRSFYGFPRFWLSNLIQTRAGGGASFIVGHLACFAGGTSTCPCSGSYSTMEAMPILGGCAARSADRSCELRRRRPPGREPKRAPTSAPAVTEK